MAAPEQKLVVLALNDGIQKQQLIVETLTSTNLVSQVIQQDDLDQARTLLDESEVDLVVADLVINGKIIFDLMEIYQHLPWIIVSDVTDHNIIKDAFKSGAADYVGWDRLGISVPDFGQIILDVMKRWNYENVSCSTEMESLSENSSNVNKLHQVNLRLAEESHQRLLALEELRESREMYRRFFQTSRDAVFITAVDGRWIDMNESALALFGYQDKEDIWSDTMLNFYWDSEQGRDYSLKLETHGVVNDLPMKFRKRDGSEIDALITAMPYEIGGKVIGYQGLIRDMTHELKAKGENLKLQKDLAILDSLASELGNLLDLNDIYACISGHIKEIIDTKWIRILKFDELQNNYKIEFEWGMNKHKACSDKELDCFEDNFQTLMKKTSTIMQTAVVKMDDSLYQDHEDSVWAEKHFKIDACQPLEYQSIVLTPIMINDQVIGIIHAGLDQNRAVVSDYLSFLTRTANIAAICLKKAYLLQHSEAHVKKLSSLQRVQQIILDNLSLPTTLDMMVDQVVTELEVDAVNILYLHPGLKSLRSISKKGFRQKLFRDSGQEIGEGLAGRAAQTKNIIHVRNLANSTENINRSLEFSTEKFVTYFGVPLLVKDRLVGVLEIFNRKALDPETYWVDLLKLIAGLVAVAIDLQNLTNDLEKSRNKITAAFDGVIMGWATALELRGIEAQGHAIRTQDLASRLAKKIGISGTGLEDIRQGALLHDIGKMGIPDEVLLKGSVLNAEEMKLVGRHPVDAFELLKSVEALKGALDIPLYHHERWDGGGYPYGIEGEKIPLSARIFAVVDVWDAMQTDRPYRKAFTRTEALMHMEEQSGKHFDPVVLNTFKEMLEADQNRDLKDVKPVKKQKQIRLSERVALGSKI